MPFSLFRRLPHAVFTAALVTAGSRAQAQDRCADLLANGAYAKLDYSRNDFFQQIIYSRFLRSTYATSKSDKAAGFGIPLGEAVMGTGNYSEADYTRKKDQINSTYLNTITQKNESQLALATGDSAIVAEWGKCMRARGGGLGMHFEALSPTEATLSTEFFSAPGTETRLPENVNLPTGVTATNGASCLRKGNRLKAGVECIATLKLPDALTTVAVSVNTPNGAATAYLPRRVTLLHESRPYQFAANCNLATNPNAVPSVTAAEKIRCADRLWEHAYRQQKTPTYTLTLSDSLVKQGWSFDPATASMTFSYLYRYSPSGMSWCYEPKYSAGLYTFTYGYSMMARWRGNDRNSQLICVADRSINMVRNIWVPQD